jgi:hypothetical protein
MAVEERRQVLAGGEAAEQIARVGQGHVERVDLRDPDMGEDLALIAPVDLRLSTGDDLEPTVQTREFARADAQLVRDPGPGFLQIDLDALVVAGEAVLLDQTLVDYRPFYEDLGSQHRVDQRRDLVHHPSLRLPVRRPVRRRDRRLPRQVLADRAPVQPGRLGDLRQAHRPGLVKTAETPQLQPAMRVQDHRQPPFCHPEYTGAECRPTGHHRIKN